MGWAGNSGLVVERIGRGTALSFLVSETDLVGEQLKSKSNYCQATANQILTCRACIDGIREWSGMKKTMEFQVIEGN